MTNALNSCRLSFRSPTSGFILSFCFAYCGTFATQKFKMPSTVETPTTYTSFSGNARVVLSDKSRKADFNEIPIISLESPHEEVVAQILDACTRVGFFYIKDHDVPQDVIDQVFDAGKSFFALPADQKNETHFRKNKLLRGYEGPGETIVDSTRKPDLNESFNWGYETELDPVKSFDTTDEGTFTCTSWL